MALYFAYGSNMSTARLRARVPDASPLGPARLAAHVLRFHKRGRDGTAKCDAHPTGDPADAVWGVLYHLGPDLGSDGRHHLDPHEPDYDPIDVTVTTPTGVEHPAFTYRARPHALDPTLHPAPWYTALVLTGAREHGLPEEYVTAVARLGGVDRLSRRR